MLERGKADRNVDLLVYNKNGDYEYPLPRNMNFNNFSYCLWRYYFYGGLKRRIYNHKKLKNCYLLLSREEDDVVSLQLVLSKNDDCTIL